MNNKIVLTGGPGAGKTTAAELLRRELGEQIIVVPESATLLFSGGFPRHQSEATRTPTQSAIFHLQKNIEEIQSIAYPNRALICDRGTVDGAVYWPKGHEDFFQKMGTNFEKELSNYNAVVFLETSAVANQSVIECGNPTRNESIEEALLLNSKLKSIWSHHNNFYHISHEDSFLEKINKTLKCIMRLL